ncbi:class I SAM-dependent methyltransferase [Amycolatopsis methanolica]|uniref:class I SAM-dependent methyltransferase n=1 Tax=Amycolatopsis methanolica TaxID=1814 RepID=UPI003F4DCFD2
MPFDHNHAYHRLLLRHVPAGTRTALDVGCGAGRFTRKLAAAGLAVEGIDPSAEVVAAARALGPGITYRNGDVTTAELDRYDFISRLASLHHVLRAALNPGRGAGRARPRTGRCGACSRRRPTWRRGWSWRRVSTSTAVRTRSRRRRCATGTRR